MMIACILALLLQASAGTWTPPAQAEWRGSGDGIAARLAAPAGTVSMRGAAAFTVTLSSRDAALRVSPFFGITRGIALEAVDARGKAAPPREPIAISPPAPPVASSGLTAVAPDAPLTVAVGERAVNVFPKPGRYRVRALVSLMRIDTRPASYKQIWTNWVDVDVAA